jgi:aspartate racemase
VKTIGLLGGMSWESSVEYERLINTEVRARLGGSASADLIIRSYNFAEIEALQKHDEWGRAGDLLAADATLLERAGADVIVLCTNTMHVVAEAIKEAITIPFIDIIDVTAAAIRSAGVLDVGLLGTRYTMEGPLYRDRLQSHGIGALVPPPEDRTIVHDIIFGELVRGITLDASRLAYVEIITRLVDAGASGIVAGCTEIELLIDDDDVPVPWFPTTRLHAIAAVDAALS